MRRKLYLVNESGSTFYFDYSHNCLIEDMDGFGFEFDIDYEEVDATYIETKRKIPQRTIQLTLDFLDGYRGFTRWREYGKLREKARFSSSARPSGGTPDIDLRRDGAWA